MFVGGAARRMLAAAAGAAALAGCGGGGGGGGGTTQTVPANQPPVAAASLVGEAVAGATTRFDSSASRDPDGSIASRQWSYGDGSSGSADSHLYMAAGSYTATLTVADAVGATATTTVPVTVAPCSAAGTQAALLSPHPAVCVQTTLGEMVYEVFPAEAPLTTANFLRYVSEKFYDGVIFHRVVVNFVIQAGGFTSGLVAKAPTHAPIALESANGLHNTPYTLAMARTDVPNSATSQFFVNLVDNSATLDRDAAAGRPGYAVFGQVISGTALLGASTVEDIAHVAVDSNGVALQEVTIRTMIRLPCSAQAAAAAAASCP